MKRPNAISRYLVGAALIATSWLASGSQSNTPIQPPPPPPKPSDREASPLHTFENTGTQQQQGKTNQSQYARLPPPPPQRPPFPDSSSLQQQPNTISSPPPRIYQSSASTLEKNSFDSSVVAFSDKISAERISVAQETQQPPAMKPVLETTPTGEGAVSDAPDNSAKRLIESSNFNAPVRDSDFQRREFRPERPSFTPPSAGSDARKHERGMQRPPIGNPPRSDVGSTYRQPYNAPPHHPRDPQTGPQHVGPNRGPLPNRPPSTGYRQTPPKRQQTPVWGQLWKRVERSLDGLADLEDVVAERAQQLYSTAKESVSSVYKRPLGGKGTESDHDLSSSSYIPSVRIWSKSRANKPASSPIPQMDMSRFNKKLTTEESGPEVASAAQKEKLPWDNTASSSRFPASPFVNTMGDKSGISTEIAQVGAYNTSQKDSEGGQDGTTSFGNGFAKSSSNHSGNTTKRIIRANGGASTPPFGGPSDSLQTNSPHQSQASLERPVAPPVRPLPSRNSVPTRVGPQPTRRSVQKNYMDDDEEDRNSSMVKKMMKALPGIPSFSIFRRNKFDTSAAATWDAWNEGDGDVPEVSTGFFGRIFRSKGDRSFSFQAPSQASAKFMSPPLQSFMDRCDAGKTLSLLKSAERIGSRRIGRILATLDVVTLVFVLVGLKQLPKLEHIILPHSLSEAFRGTLPQFAHCFIAGLDTWAPFAFIAAFLTLQTRQLVYKAKLATLTHILDASISEEAQYGALFLRLYTSSAYFRDISDRLRTAAHSQLTARIDLTRLRALVTIFLASMLLMTVPVITPLMMALFGTLQHIFGLELLHSWPPKWDGLLENILSSWSSFANKASELIAEELKQMSDHPKQVVFGLSIAAALLIVSRLPGSRQDKITAEPAEIDEEEDATFIKFTEQVSNLGVSSSNRIALLSDVGGIDSALERWRLLIPRGAEVAYTRRSLQSILRIMWKGSASAIVLALPLLVQHYYSGLALSSNHNSFPSWGSLTDVSFVLLLTQFLSWKSLSSSLLADESRGAVAGFVMSLQNAANERLSRLNAPPISLQQQVAISPSAGLEVKDLWAAHTTKRAWAVRGVNLECRSGNVLLILGDDSAGKSRLLTALAEAVARPPPQAFTTTRVRGSIRVAGIEINKWDYKLLQKRVWSLLHDVRSMSDFSQILSGMSIEEILEPSGGIRYLELSHRPGPNERATMMLALKLAGLNSSLLPKLPSKLSTVVTANEEDIRPSAFRPLYSMLSPAEWSKLLLARVFSQAIYENDNVASTIDKLENCLVGSLLLLDDATLYLPEVEEARMLRDLRATGAATVLTSNRWALGRLADQIVVMRDGAVLESGTHAELLSRGAQQSLYAAKWHAMTSQ